MIPILLKIVIELSVPEGRHKSRNFAIAKFTFLAFLCETKLRYIDLGLEQWAWY